MSYGAAYGLHNMYTYGIIVGIWYTTHNPNNTAWDTEA